MYAIAHMDIRISPLSIARGRCKRVGAEKSGLSACRDSQMLLKFRSRSASNGSTANDRRMGMYVGAPTDIRCSPKLCAIRTRLRIELSPQRPWA
jgi:hypothetical protein